MLGGARAGAFETHGVCERFFAQAAYAGLLGTLRPFILGTFVVTPRLVTYGLLRTAVRPMGESCPSRIWHTLGEAIVCELEF